MFFNFLLIFLLFSRTAAQNKNTDDILLVQNQYPLNQVQNNPFWDEIKKEIAEWLPIFVMDFRYPNLTNNISGVEVQTFNTTCESFEVDQKTMDIQLEPGFPNFKGVITATVSQANFSTGLTWKKMDCIWILPCLDVNDTVDVTLTDFTLLMHVLMDINPFDHNMTPKLTSANVTLEQVDIHMYGHWYDQWLYDLVMKVQGQQIDQMAKKAIENVIRKKLNTSPPLHSPSATIQLSQELDEMVQELQQQLVVEQ